MNKIKEKKNITGRILIVGLVLTALAVYQQPVWATRLPKELKKTVLELFPQANIRLDGTIQSKQNELFVPIIPKSKKANSASEKEDPYSIRTYYPDKDEPELIVVNNGWCFLKINRSGSFTTVLSLDKIPASLQKTVLAGKLPTDFIVPEHFVLPKSLKDIIGDVSITTMEDAKLESLSQITKTSMHKQLPLGSPNPVTGLNALFVTSVGSGSILYLTEKENTLKKVVQFPTEGTPFSMAYTDGKVYISDQSKNRILILDPVKKQFLGQINLDPKAYPKGICISPDGNIIYVAESGSSQVAMIERSTQKLLMRTKVPPGPSQLVMSPNGNYLLVLSKSSGQLAFIACELGHKVIGIMHLGAIPSRIAFDSDGDTAYVTLRGSNHVLSIDIVKRAITHKMETGSGPTGVAVSPDNKRLFVANARENSLTIFSLETFQETHTIKLPIELDFPGSLHLMPDSKHLLVPSEGSSSVGLFNIDTLQFDQISNIGESSHEVLYVP